MSPASFCLFECKYCASKSLVGSINVELKKSINLTIGRPLVLCCKLEELDLPLVLCCKLEELDLPLVLLDPIVIL